MDRLTIRPATPSDRPCLRAPSSSCMSANGASTTRGLPGEETADAYLDWMLDRGAEGGAVLVAEVGGAFAGFAAGWIVQETSSRKRPISNRFGCVSDVCVLPPFRGRRIASALLEALEARLRQGGVTRIRLSALAANAAARKVYERSGYALYEVVYEKSVGADSEDFTS